jgi:chromosome segregation ATPase
MTTHAENLNAKIAIASFQKDIENWKKVNEDLKTAFRTKPEFSEQIFKLMDDVDDELEILSSQLSRFRFDPDQEDTEIRRIQSHFERKNDVLSEAKAHRDEIQRKFREITQEPSGTPEKPQEVKKA